MTHQNQSSELNEAVQLLAENGFEGMADRHCAKGFSWKHAGKTSVLKKTGPTTQNLDNFQHVCFVRRPTHSPKPATQAFSRDR